MAEYDSDSSAGEEGDISTNVLLGYASKEPTGDDFSQLGGRPVWLDGDKYEPSGALARCKSCNGTMSLLLQLMSDLPERFPGHERRLYVFACRKKTCRRKTGSVRALRATRSNAVVGKTEGAEKSEPPVKAPESKVNLGETLFGAKAPTPAQANPFASKSSETATANPFATTKTDAKAVPVTTQSATVNTLSTTFAQKASIASTSETPLAPAEAHEPWTKDPSPFPSAYVDAEIEYLEPEANTIPANARVDSEGGGGSAADEKAAFESAMDKTFQSFADRLSHNPEQILRYEFSGQPLLYTKSDAVGKLLSPSSAANAQMTRVPRCSSCGAARTFELQLTPHAITELEVEETGLDGMEWGTIIVAVCIEDCTSKRQGEKDISYLEEWVGVQWEEVVSGKSR